MSLYKLLIREISHRKLNCLLSLLSVTVAVACIVGINLLIEGYQSQRDKIFDSALNQQETLLRKAENQYRISTKKFGYNVLILPKNQNIEDFYADDFASKYMPEKYVNKLALGGVVTARHFLPILEQKIRWPEGKRTIILIGTRGEVANAYKRRREPMFQPVKPGNVVVGYQIYKKMNLRRGDKIKLFGKTFNVSILQPERGTKDDITLWISLKEAQKLLRKQGRINAILALQCVCSGGDFSKVPRAIESVLPDTQVLAIDTTKIKSREEIRATAKKLTKQTLHNDLQTRDEHIRALKNLTRILFPIIIMSSVIWVGFLAFSNVRERKYEIGLLRAIGVKTSGILTIFLAKAYIIGLMGAGLGYAAGVLTVIVCSALPYKFFSPVKPAIILSLLVIVPLFTVVASWLPALIAASQDPADVLREE